MQDSEMSLAGRAFMLVEQSRGLIHRSRALRDALKSIGDTRQMSFSVGRRGMIEALGSALRT